MNTLVTALSGISFVVNGAVFDAKSTSGYFEVVTPTASSAHANLGWTDADKAYTLEPKDDGDGDTKTPLIDVDQENFAAVADEAVLTGTATIATEIDVHNKTLEVALDGGHMQEITFDGGPIVGANIFVVGNTLTGATFGFNVNGVAQVDDRIQVVTFAGGDPISIASAISQINAAAGVTVVYESDSAGVPTGGGGYLAWQVGGATKVDGGSIDLDFSVATGTAWSDLGLTGVVDIFQTSDLTEIVSQINDTMGAGFADETTVVNKLTLPLCPWRPPVPSPPG